MYSQSFVNVNIHGLASKIHTLKIEVNCFRARPFDYDQYNTFRTFYTYSATDQDDIDNMRINDTHNLGKAGQGVTICLMIDGLGYDDVINSNYHQSIYKEYSNVIRDVEYFVCDTSTIGDDPSFKKLTQDWDQLTPSEKWDKIRIRSAGDTENMHGTGALSSLVQIAPHAKYIFIEHHGDLWKTLAAVKWMADEDIHKTYDIEVVNLYWARNKSEIENRLDDTAFWGENLPTWSDFEDWFDYIANDGGLNQKVVIVSPAASTGTTYQGISDARYPAAFDTTIGVTGVNDDNGGDDSWKLKIGDETLLKDNNGYGIDVAALDNCTNLPWTIAIIPDYGPYNIFSDTCNAAVFVTGITALLKQVYDPLTVSQLQEVLQYTGDAEGDSPKNYGTESGGAYESLDPYDEYTNFGTYLGNYRIAWGIIDVYESYLYILDNIMP